MTTARLLVSVCFVLSLPLSVQAEDPELTVTDWPGFDAEGMYASYNTLGLWMAHGAVLMPRNSRLGHLPALLLHGSSSTSSTRVKSRRMSACSARISSRAAV